MSDEGYHYIERKFYKSKFWTEKRVFSKAEAMIDLIQRASFCSKTLWSNSREVSISRGSLPFNLRDLASRWGWGVKRTNNFLKLLQKGNTITIKRQHGVSLLTLVKYGEFQLKEQKGQQAVAKKETMRQQAGNKQISKPLKDKGLKTPKEGKEGKEKTSSYDDETFFKKGDGEYQESIRKETGNAEYSLIAEILEFLREYGVTDLHKFLERYSLKDIYEELLYCEDNKETIKNKGATLRMRLKGREV